MFADLTSFSTLATFPYHQGGPHVVNMIQMIPPRSRQSFSKVEAAQGKAKRLIFDGIICHQDKMTLDPHNHDLQWSMMVHDVCIVYSD